MNRPYSVAALLIRPDDGYVLAVSRRDEPDNLGLPGGKVEEHETPEEALGRETNEETSVLVQDAVFCYERVDATNGELAWVYRVTDWTGEPKQREPGIIVVWVPLSRLLEPNCSFAEYNRGLFTHLGLM